MSSVDDLRATDPNTTSNFPVIAQFLNAALSAVGQPYVWGGNSLAAGVDCSGLVAQALQAAGYMPPRTAATQMEWAQPISASEAQPGDLVFWPVAGSSDRVPGADHVGIYLGNGQAIEASSGQGKVVVRSLWGNHTFGRVIGVKDRAAPRNVPLGSSGMRWDGSGISDTAPPPGAEGEFSTDPYAVAQAAPGLPPNATDEQVEQFIRDHYAPSQAALLDIPELREPLLRAARENMTPDRMMVEIESTDWWQSREEATRTWDVLKVTDPAEAQARLSAKEAELRAEIAPLGLNLGGDEGVTQWAENAIRYNWTPEQLREKLAAQLTRQSQRDGFNAGTAPDLTADNLMEIARNEYFVPISRMDAERWAVDIFNGSKTEDSLRDYFARLAESRFPGLAEQGFTPGEYMAPVRNLIAQTLELNPVDVDLLDPRWSEVLETQGKEGRFRPMTLGEAGRWARSQQEYRQTDQAQREAAGLAETLMQTFGAV